MLNEKQQKLYDIAIQAGIPEDIAIKGATDFGSTQNNTKQGGISMLNSIKKDALSDLQAEQEPETGLGNRFIGRISELASETGKRFADIPSDIAETVKGVYGSIKDAGKDAGEELGEVYRQEQNPLQGGLRVAGDVAGGVTGAFGEIMMGIGKLGLTPEEEQAFKNTAIEVIESEPVQTGIELYNKVLDKGSQEIAQRTGTDAKEVRENIDSLIQSALAPFEVLGAGAGLRAGRTRLRAAEDIASRGGETLIRGAEDARQAIKNVEFTMPKLGLGATFDDLIKSKSPLVRDLTADEINIGIKPAFKATLSGQKDSVLVPYIDEAIRGWDDPDADLYGLGRERVNAVMDKVSEELNNVGGEIGSIRQKFASTPSDAKSIQSIESKFKNDLENVLGRKIIMNEDGVSLAPTGGRNIRLSASDENAILDAFDDIQQAKAGTKQTMLDNRVNIDSIVDFDKNMSDPIDAKVQNVLKGLRSEYKTALEKGLTPDEVALNETYANMLGVIRGYEKASSKGNNIEYFLDRVYGTRGSQTKDVMREIENITGANLQAEALALRLANMVSDPSKQSRLRQAITDAGVDIVNKSVPTGVLGDVYNSFKALSDIYKKKQGIQPDFENAVEIADILKNMNI